VERGAAGLGLDRHRAGMAVGDDAAFVREIVPAIDLTD
jgi:hypothetical protein